MKGNQYPSLSSQHIPLRELLVLSLSYKHYHQYPFVSVIVGSQYILDLHFDLLNVSQSNVLTNEMTQVSTIFQSNQTVFVHGHEQCVVCKAYLEPCCQGQVLKSVMDE